MDLLMMGILAVLVIATAGLLRLCVMTGNDWMQIVLYFGVLLLLAVPLGRFMAQVLSGEGNWLTRLGRPLERGLYRLAGISEDDEMAWTRYATAFLVFSVASFAVVYLLQRLQGFLPANPAGFGAVSPAVAFNTAISFASNTNWQAYGGESTMSYLTQALALGVQNFGLAICRGIVRAHGGRIWAEHRAGGGTLMKFTIPQDVPPPALDAFEEPLEEEAR